MDLQQPAHAQQGSVAATKLQTLEKLNPHLVHRSGLAWPHKLHALTRSEYDFFRGTADLFAIQVKSLGDRCFDKSVPPVLLHGDLHPGNIGTFQSTGPDNSAIHFGLVDLDEAMAGPFEYDLLRAATALRFAEAETDLELDEAAMGRMIGILCDSYANALVDQPSDAELAKSFPIVRKLMRKAAKEELGVYVAKFAHGKPLRFRTQRTKKSGLSDIMNNVDDAMRTKVVDAVWQYMKRGVPQETRARFRFRDRSELNSAVRDVAMWTRVGSSGSQGLKKFLILLDAPLTDVREPIILQLKEEPLPAAARAGLLTSGAGASRAAEVAAASRNINPDSPWLIGYTQIEDVGFLVKTKDPWGKEPDTDDLVSAKSVQNMAALLGALLGRSHARYWTEYAPEWRIDMSAASIRNRSPQFVEYSERLETAIRAAFTELSSDPNVAALRKRAEEFLAGQSER